MSALLWEALGLLVVLAYLFGAGLAAFILASVIRDRDKQVPR